jgi:predicted amidohydrolase YtcJ
MAATAACARQPPHAADVIVTNARIWTGDPRRPEAAALAIAGDRIVDIGAADVIDRLRGSSTTVVDAEGRRVLPGFNDARVHVIDAGARLDQVALTDADSPSEFARRIGERAKARRSASLPGVVRQQEWILGGAWDERRWTPAQLPTRQLVDDLTNGTPVFVTRYDGRMALANSTVLGRAGIGERTRDPVGGRIVRDANGFPTGLLEGAAIQLVSRVVPPMTVVQRTRALERALEHAASLGVTTMQDAAPSKEDVALYAEFRNRGGLTVRIDSARWPARSLGTDWPKAPLNPFLKLQTAVTSGHQSMADAVAAYTRGAAAAESLESDKGTLTRGKLADLIVVSDDILVMPASHLQNAYVLVTIVGGRVVHRRKP